VNREAEPDQPSRVACSDLLAVKIVISILLVSINADGLSRATPDGLHALAKLIRCLGLMENIRPTLLIALPKNRRGCLVAKAAVDARGIHIKLAAHILWNSGLNGCHVRNDG
jgi:hypothetical protein